MDFKEDNKYTNDRVKKLEPRIRSIVKHLINKMKNENGLSFRIGEDGHFRTFKEQDDLFRKRKSKAKGGESFHNYELAVDLYLIKNGKLVTEKH